MKAIVQHDYGTPEVLRYDDVPTPTVGPDDVLIAVHAVSVNRTLDLAVRENRYLRKAKLPHILGVDPSGIVVAVGENVATRRPGDRVFVNMFVPTDDPSAIVVPEIGHTHVVGIDIWGGYADYVRVPASVTYPIPAALSFCDATVVARHGPTALNLIEHRGQVKPGEWVLVMGASGGLGSAAVQVAKINGATVIAAAGADDRVAAACRLGADHGINYRSQDLAKEVARLTDGRGVDILCENVGDPTLWEGAFNSLAVRGRMVTAGSHAGDEVKLSLKRLYLRRLQIIGDGSQAPGGLERSFALAAQGKMSALIDRVMPLAEAADAHRIVGGREGIGKIVLDPTLS